MGIFSYCRLRAAGFLCFLLFMGVSALPARADAVNLELVYGYQNTAKAGRFLPFRVDIENTMEETFSGFIHIYMAESGNSLYEYCYQAAVEPLSESVLQATLSIGTGVNQILVTAENREGVVLGQKRIGLDVAGSDAELIIGILSGRESSLVYLNGISIYDGLLRTRTVNLNPERVPSDAAELDQLDVLLISGYEMEQIKESEAAAIYRWVEGGGTLLIGTGSLGNAALYPWFGYLLKNDLNPAEISVNMGDGAGNDYPAYASQTMEQPVPAGVEGVSEDDAEAPVQEAAQPAPVSTVGEAENDADAAAQETAQPASGSMEENGIRAAGAQSLFTSASPVYLYGGRDILFSNSVPMVAAVSRGAGTIAVSGYDFCELQGFAADQPDYIDRLLQAVIGKSRLDVLSVSASERSLNQYWDIQELMNFSNSSKVPHVSLYLAILASYVILSGPVLYFYIRQHGALPLYRPALLILAVLFALLVWTMGIGTRFNGTFLTYAKLRDISEKSIDETDFINVRSPYNTEYGMDIRTEYYVYPVVKGSGYTGDIIELSRDSDTRRTTIDYGREHTTICVRNESSFTAKYFELSNKIPNSDGSFSGEVSLFSGVPGGYIENGTDYTLYDAAILLYGMVLKIGRLEPGQRISLSEVEYLNVPVGGFDQIAREVTGGSGRNFLRYYLSTQLDSYYADARLVGFVRDDELGFADEDEVESYGVTMILSTLPLTSRSRELYSYNVLRTDPVVEKGDYDIQTNTVSGISPVVLSYHLGDEEEVQSLSFASLSGAYGEASGNLSVSPFRGTVSFYNYGSGAFDVMDLRSGLVEKEALTPYLQEGNVLRVRYVVRDETIPSFARLYLPMITVVSREPEGQREREETAEGAPFSLEEEGDEESWTDEAGDEGHIPGEEYVETRDEPY